MQLKCSYPPRCTGRLFPAPPVLTVLNLKGGVGKTPTAWLIASVCQERGRQLLAADRDPQGNLTSSFLPGPDGRPGSELLYDPRGEADFSELVRKTAFDHIDRIPSSPSLARFDLSDQRPWEKTDQHLTLRDPVAELRSQYDY